MNAAVKAGYEAGRYAQYARTAIRELRALQDPSRKGGPLGVDPEVWLGSARFWAHQAGQQIRLAHELSQPCERPFGEEIGQASRGEDQDGCSCPTCDERDQT